MTRELLTGGEAVAHAMRQIDPDVVPVYPITPQTPIIQTFAKFVADGRAHTEVVNVESEHSAMSAAIGAALAGARTMTATSSQGLALMAEVVYIAASMRAPIVMAVGNRALSGPINIHCDHSDSMLVRDSGVVQLFAENAQEAYDLRCRLLASQSTPMCCCRCSSARTVSRSLTRQSRWSSSRTTPSGRSSASTASPTPYSTFARPTTQGPFAMPDYYFELRRQQTAALEAALDESSRKRPANSRCSRAACTGPRGVSARGCFASARRARLVRGHDQGRGRRVARRRGCRVGLLKLVSFRPFPTSAVASALADVDSVIVLDRADSPGGTPPLHAELASALYGGGVELNGAVYGLGGRDLHPADIRAVLTGPPAAYVGVRGESCPV